MQSLEPKATQQDTGLQITYRPLKGLTPYARNARTHPREQIQKIKASLAEYGWANPMLVADGGMIAGHGRLAAALEMAEQGIAIPRNPDPWMGPTVDLSHLTPLQRRAYVLMDNRSALDSGWDEEMLAMELGELSESMDLSLTGFETADIEALLAGALPDGQTDPDDAPPAPVHPVSVLGDVWILGKHRILCGSSTDADDVKKALNGVTPNLMVTDPPYGVKYDPAWRQRAGIGSKGTATGKVLNDDQADWREAWALFPGNVAYVWHAGIYAGVVEDSLKSCKFRVRSQIVWVKTRHVLSRGHYHPQHEPCQPAGTLVWKVVKPGRWREQSVIEEVPIETLQAGDMVVSYSGTDATDGGARIHRRGCPITRIGSRVYAGNMHRIEAAGHSTRATAEHRFTARFDPAKAKAAVLYLMRRGDRWRVGVCGLFNSRGFGAAVRMDQERADEVWIVSAHPDMRSARVAEQVASCVYGIPTTHWEIGRNIASSWIQRDHGDIEAIYQQIGMDRIGEGVQRLMADRGLRLEYPLISAQETGRFSRKQPRLVRACNLVPGIMQLPVPTHGEKFEWHSVAGACFERVQDVEVWSMDVERDQHYIADGLVTHNCLYSVREGAEDDGWQGRAVETSEPPPPPETEQYENEHMDVAYAVREGGTGEWRGGRKQSTVWFIEHLKSETGHGTQKPVEAMKRPIENNSSPGQAVYEPFSGSGTTIIACEMTGRSCHAIELSPAYVDVAALRWEKFTGKTAIHEATGKTFAEMAAARPFGEAMNVPETEAAL